MKRVKYKFPNFDNICDGCKGRCGTSAAFSIDKKNQISICPCATCVIKVMCTEGCKEFAEFFRTEVQ